MVLATLDPYIAIGATILLVALAALGALVIAHTIGPKRRGAVKDSPYESGMPVIGDTHRRFNIRYYIVAMLFLLFDVEVIFLWPWVTAYYRAAVLGEQIPMEGVGEAGAGFLLVGMGMFFLLLVFGLVYEWKRGAFEWE